MIKLIKNIYKQYVIKKYTNKGIDLGSDISYSFMGNIDGFESKYQSFLKLEKQISDYQYLPYHLSQLIQAGGYGIPLPKLQLGTPESIELRKKENLLELNISVEIQNNENSFINLIYKK